MRIGLPIRLHHYDQKLFIMTVLFFNNRSTVMLSYICFQTFCWLDMEILCSMECKNTVLKLDYKLKEVWKNSDTLKAPHAHLCHLVELYLWREQETHHPIKGKRGKKNHPNTIVSLESFSFQEDTTDVVGAKSTSSFLKAYIFPRILESWTISPAGCTSYKNPCFKSISTIY